MSNRLKQGDIGDRVEQLHGWLRTAGRILDAAEVEARHFGEKTREALTDLQTHLGLPVTGELDLATTAVIEAGPWPGGTLVAEVTLSIEDAPPSSDPSGPPSSSPPPPPPSGTGGGSPPPNPTDQGTIRGTLVDQDGAPLPETRIRAFDKQLRTETRIAQTTTDAAGHYTLRYPRPKPLNLLLRAYDRAKHLIAESPTTFAAPADLEINLTTAKDGISRTPSTFTTLQLQVTAHLGETPLADLIENKDTHELQFLASTAAASFNEVARLYLAHKLATQHGLRSETLFGLFVQSIPPTLPAALADLPDAGIDDTFTAQILAALLAHDRDTLSRALGTAIAANTLPASYTDALDSELARLDHLRRQGVASAPYVRGKTPLNDLLIAADIAEPVKAAFIAHYADRGGRLGPVWKALRADESLHKADLDRLDTTLKAGEILGGNIPLVKHTLARLEDSSLPSLRHLARLGEAQWESLLREVDPEAASIPPVLLDDTTDLRVARFAQSLAERFTARYPTIAFAGGLERATESPFEMRQELLALFDAHPELDLMRMNVDAYIAKNELRVSPPALEELKVSQRLLRIAPTHNAVEALIRAGHKSSQSIYFEGPVRFLSKTSETLGGTAIAKATFARAEMTYASSLAAFGQYHLSINGIPLHVMPSRVPDARKIERHPTLKSLFGSADFCECSDCRSVLSPAAYLVDLLEFLRARGVLDELLSRRPDIERLALNCNNTNVTLPYIDLVNEILEDAVEPPTNMPTVIDTTGTSAERRAMPQQINPAAYHDHTAKVAYPLSLPFDLSFAETTAYLAGLGTSLSAVMQLFPPPDTGLVAPTPRRGNPRSGLDWHRAQPVRAHAIAGAMLGLSPAMRAIITGSDKRVSGAPWELWGLQESGNQPISAWTEALGSVPILLERSGLTLRELFQLVEEVAWVRGGEELHVHPGFKVIDNTNEKIVSCKTDDMTIEIGGVDPPQREERLRRLGPVLSRAGRFIRLWRATGLAMWELDWALAPWTTTATPAAGLGDDFLVFLAQALAVRARLGLPFQELLAFWHPLGATAVVSHLGDKDEDVPSPYDAVFRSLTLVKAWQDVFGPGATPTVDRALQGRTAALGLGAPDIAKILGPSAVVVDPANLTPLFRHARLASSLSLSIPDFLLWIDLTEVVPWDSPADTLEFLRRLAVLQDTGLSATDLDYLLRGRSEERTALAFTAADAVAAFDAFRAAIAKLPAAALGFLASTGVSPYRLQPDQVLSLDLGNGPVLITFSAKPAELISGSQDYAALLDGDEVTLAYDDEQPFTVTFTAKDTTQAAVIARINEAAGFAFASRANDSTIKLTSPRAGSKALVKVDSGSPAGVLGKLGLARGTKSGNGNVADIAAVQPLEVATLAGILVRLDDRGALWIAGKERSVAVKDGNAASGLGFSPEDRAVGGGAEAVLTQALATALGTTASIVFPVLSRLKILPFAITTIIDLLEKDATGAYKHGLGDFPQLLSAFTTVAKAAKLVDALRPSESELAFLIAQDSRFGWIDPGLSHFVSFEQVLQALTLNRRQRARSTKLFEVLAGWWTKAPDNITKAIEELAPALGAAIDDLTPIAAALGATTLAWLADIGVLWLIASALDACARYKMSGRTLVLLSADAPTDATAAAARATFQAQYDPQQWLEVIRPIEDALRAQRRDALVAYLLGTTGASVDDLFGRYLIDPEMSPCALTTRLLQASLAIQQFVQRCYLGLEDPIRVDADADERWNEWSWMKQFRLWQANREVFLYPENYLLPELRKDKSPFFTELENDLRQGQIDADSAEKAFAGYLHKLVDVSKLVVKAHCQETKPDGSRILHVFACTRGTPPRWYYRQRAEAQPGHGPWTAWEVLNLDIASEHLLPVMWNGRLHLVWTVFKEQTAQQEDPMIPKTGDANAPPEPVKQAKKFWTIEFAISERRGGQWQPKRTLAEKMFFGSWVSLPAPQQFALRSFEDGQSALQIQLYWDDRNDGGRHLMSAAEMSSSDDPLRVTAVGRRDGSYLLPAPGDIDPGREPSHALVTRGAKDAWNSIPLMRSDGYTYLGQDLVYNHTRQRKAIGEFVPLNVICRWSTGKKHIFAPLLFTRIVNPHVIVPQQKTDFESAHPFFVSDVNRVLFVQPHHYTVSSYPQEIENVTVDGLQWFTQYVFSPFYHPFARTFLRELEIGGVDQLMSRDIQKHPETVRDGKGSEQRFDFVKEYAPTKHGFVLLKIEEDDGSVAEVPVWAVNSTAKFERVDFSPDGAYSLYNWEIFYHAPMFVASLLMQNHRHEEAMKWLEYIFDPTDASGGETPGRYWRTLPLHRMHQKDWTDQQIDQLLTTYAADRNAATDQAIQDWRDLPFDPHRIARTRIGAYGKATVMRFLDNLIAWGDALFGQDTMESVNQAEQVYILAQMILGPATERVRLPAQYQPDARRRATYASVQAGLDGFDGFSNTLAEVENIVGITLPMPRGSDAGRPRPMLPRFIMESGKVLLFCIPPNDTLLAYWDTVADRLDKIRNCRNLAGVVRQLPLYAPKIDPLLLIRAGGADGLQALGTTVQPIYRFATYLQKALELANDVRSLGSLVLSALEKKDAEALASLRSGHELDVLTRMREVKAMQLQEASDQIAALHKQRDVVVIRRDFYSDIAFMNAGEILAIALHGGATALNTAALVLDLTAGVVSAIPQYTVGISGFGGTPVATVTGGGEQIKAPVLSTASVLHGLAGILNEGGQLSATMGSYQRRSEDWDMQRRTADAELGHIDAQITAATDRCKVVETELAVHDQQIANAKTVDDFLKSKYTNAQLYDWMLSKLTTVHTQTYQLAVDLAQRANAAFNYELGRTDVFIQPDYWDSQRQGLLAGERLLFDLRRMETSYLDANARELELTKHISLALTDPSALLDLRQKGSCSISFREEMFDLDHPGHYFRRIRSVALTIPCVTGPYTGVNATLTLGSNEFRTTPTINGPSRSMPGGTQIAISSGQNDAGIFDVNLRDERWLPFEGKGAVSTWTLELNPADNAFDLSTVTDVVFHLRYTARQGGNADAVRAALRKRKAQSPRTILVSVRDTFADAYHRFFNPMDPKANEQTLTLPLESPLFPYSSLGAPQISNVDVYLVTSVDHGLAQGGGMNAKFGPMPPPSPPATPSDVTFTAGPGAKPSWTLVGPASLSNAKPGSFTLTVPQANVPENLQPDGSKRLDPKKVTDIVLVITYTLA